MPTPQGLKTVTVHGRFVEPDLVGTPLAGSLVFTPNVPMVMFLNENTLMSGSEIATLDSNGEFVIELVCTSTPGQTPEGWAYTVLERLVGANSRRTYQIFLPYTDQIVELSDIIPSPEAPTYLPVLGPPGNPGPPGVVQSVNGVSMPDILLDAYSVQAVSAFDDQTILGVKTFDASPIAPYPTVPAQVATAEYVNTLVGDTVKLSGAQSVGGVKTFTSLPVLPASDPTTANQAVRKSYVDTAVNTTVKLTGNQSVAGEKTFSSIGRWKAAGDTVERLILDPAGRIILGDGLVAPETEIYRSAAGQLTMPSVVLANLSVQGIGQFRCPIKPTATARASTIVVAADPHLTASVEANASYLIEVAAAWESGGGGMRVTFNGPVGAEMTWAANQGGGGTINYEVTLGSTLGGQFRGLLKVGPTAGTVVFAWAQSTSNASPTNLLANSSMSIRRVS